jgi:hypothetical protein
MDTDVNGKLLANMAYNGFAGNRKICRESIKMTIRTFIVSILCIMIAGCTSLPSVEDNQTERQVIDIYDNQGNVKEHVIIKDGYITIYDKDWKTKGYGRVQE